MRKIQCAVCMSKNYLCNKCKYQTKSWLCLELLDIQILSNIKMTQCMAQAGWANVKWVCQKITEYYSTYIKNAPICVYYPTSNFWQWHMWLHQFFRRSMHQSNFDRQWIQFWKHNNFDNLQRPSSLRCDDSSRFRHPQKIESMAGHAPALLVQFWLSPFHTFCHWKVEAVTSATSVKSWRVEEHVSTSHKAIQFGAGVEYLAGRVSLAFSARLLVPRNESTMTKQIGFNKKRVELLICYVKFRCKYFLVP
jgi:hypothetical protein